MVELSQKTKDVIVGFIAGSGITVFFAGIVIEIFYIQNIPFHQSMLMYTGLGIILLGSIVVVIFKQKEET